MRLRFPFPAPQPASPSAAASASFSMATDTLKICSSSRTGFSLCQPGRKFTSPITPLKASFAPLHPRPIPEISAPAETAASFRASTMRFKALWKPCVASVGNSIDDRTCPFSSTPPTAIFVPPISTPAIIWSPTFLNAFLLPLHHGSRVWLQFHFPTRSLHGQGMSSLRGNEREGMDQQGGGHRYFLYLGTMIC